VGKGVRQVDKGRAVEQVGDEKAEDLTPYHDFLERDQSYRDHDSRPEE